MIPTKMAAVVPFTEFCLCTRCGDDLADTGQSLMCTACGTAFEVRDGIAVMMPETRSELEHRYAASYEQVALDDLAHPFERDRESKHAVLREFIGSVAGQRVLDVGAGTGELLRLMNADVKVALDLALPFLEAIPEEGGITRVLTDAELLPVRPGYFDVVVVSDVLEHILEPEVLAARLKRVCRPDTRVIVHVPWREDLSKYASSPYEFTHLRNFDEYSFATIWQYFSVRRRRNTYPILEEPIVFQLKRFMPLRIYDALVNSYFHGNLLEHEYQRRARWIEELPRRERWLLRVYPPAFMMFELRLRPEHASADAVRVPPLTRRRWPRR